jgi:hypothetical protein
MTIRSVSREDVVGVIGFEVERVVAKLSQIPTQFAHEAGIGKALNREVVRTTRVKWAYLFAIKARDSLAAGSHAASLSRDSIRAVLPLELGRFLPCAITC